MTMKRCSIFIACFLTLIMVFNMIPVTVLAADDTLPKGEAGSPVEQGPELEEPEDPLHIAGKSGALVIYDKNRYTLMTSEKHTTSGRLKATDINASKLADGEIYTRPQDAPTKWEISYVDGAYNIKSGDLYLDLSNGINMKSTAYPVKIENQDGKYRLMETTGKTSVNLKSHKTAEGFQASNWTTSKGNAIEPNELFMIVPIHVNNDVTVVFNSKGAPGKLENITAEIGNAIKLPDYPVNYVGNELIGWTLDANKTENSKIYKVEEEYILPDKETVTFYAVWERRNYVSFNINGGTGETPESITIKDKAVTVTMPENTSTKDGYKFIGWSRTDKPYAYNGTPYNIYRPGEQFTVEPGKNTTMYAVWSDLNEQHVEFGIRLDGTIPDEPGHFDKSLYSEHVKTDQKVNEQRWVVDVTGHGRIDGNHIVNAVTENLTRLPTDEELKGIIKDYDPETQYVHWYVMKWQGNNDFIHIDGVILDRNMKTITYSKNAANEIIDIPLGYQVESGHEIIVGAAKGSSAAADPVRTGYTFTGWNTQADGNGDSYQSGAKIKVNDNLTLYATWSKGKLKITVKNSDGENDLSGAKFALKQDSKQLTELDSNKSFDSLENDTIYSLEETTIPKGYNKLSEKFFFKVVPDSEGELALQVCDSKGVVIDTPEWLTVSDATVTNGVTQITITVKDEPKKYNVTFVDADGMTVYTSFQGTDAPINSIYAAEGTEITLPTPEKEGFVFTGWNTKEDGSGNGYTVDDLFEITEDITLYAQWIESAPMSIYINTDWPDGQEGYEGARITLIAELTGFEGKTYTLQWQYSTDRENWINVPNAHGTRYTYTLNKETTNYIWRVIAVDVQ